MRNDDQSRARAGRRTGLTAVALGAVAVLACGCSHAAPPQEQQRAAAAPAPAGGPQQLSIWLTGYSWQDNTPPGSSKVGEPVLHQTAAGQGTFADPITVAVPGHKGDMDWQPGTKFYLPSVQRYVIVEDSGAAKAPGGTDTHLDMWIDGQSGTKQSTDACESLFTGKVPAQVNPPDNMKVMTGPIFAGARCNLPAQPENLGTYKNADGDGDSGDDGSGDDGSGDDGGGGGHGHHHHGDDSDDNDDGSGGSDN